ncbi:Tellurite resistance protein TerB [Zhengella mangrovi]|uniref:Tellurite resistance protein TerB n=1 Tax=Zhengella mangrovi TaxID=1982044 RepID=A0A2G1QJ89_9HYPH|nr:tellurite resistance TerB family protein [Zhengella mangrovi]PHP65514.1 Tellurite resistance protein TerB [Zhengella mangrovi]
MSLLAKQDALVYVMVVMSAVDRSMSDDELERIGNLINTLPVFRGYGEDRLMDAARVCQELLQGDDGLDRIFDIVLESVPPRLYDTAYAVAVEVAAADLHVEQEELRFLQMLRDRLGLDKLTVAAIERGAQARFRTSE